MECFCGTIFKQIPRILDMSALCVTGLTEIVFLGLFSVCSMRITHTLSTLTSKFKRILKQLASWFMTTFWINFRVFDETIAIVEKTWFRAGYEDSHEWRLRRGVGWGGRSVFATSCDTDVPFRDAKISQQSNPHLLDVLHVACKFGNMWSTCGQHEIECTEYGMRVCV
jgi:hypothetical protein